MGVFQTLSAGNIGTVRRAGDRRPGRSRRRRHGDREAQPHHSCGHESDRCSRPASSHERPLSAENDRIGPGTPSGRATHRVRQESGDQPCGGKCQLLHYGRSLTLPDHPVRVFGRGKAARERALSGNGMQGRNWVLAAMIFAVSMTFIDQTIVSIAVPNIQRELGLSSTGVQWVVNGYLISLAALFALGGRLWDIFGHTKMCVIGVIVFVVASAMCGLTPKGSARRPGSSRSVSSRVPAGRSCSRRRSPSWSTRSRCGNAVRRWRCSSALPGDSPPSARSWADSSPSGPGAPSSG